MRQNWRRGINCGGEVSSPSGLGNPTPTDAASVAHVPIFVSPVSWWDMPPSGAKCGRIGGAVSIVGERFPRPAGWGTQPLRMQLRLLTFQFSCLPYPGAACRPSGAKTNTGGSRFISRRRYVDFGKSTYNRADLGNILRVLLRLCGESYHVSRLTFHFP